MIREEKIREEKIREEKIREEKEESIYYPNSRTIDRTFFGIIANNNSFTAREWHGGELPEFLSRLNLGFLIRFQIYKQTLSRQFNNLK